MIEVMREFKAALLGQDERIMAEMAGRWMGIEKALEGQMMALALEIDGLREAGEVIQAGKLARMDRYRELVAQAKIEVNRYLQWADELGRQQQFEMGALGLQNATVGIEQALTDARLTVRFAMLPTSAIENMIGLAGNGSPLYKLLKEAYPDAVEGLTNALLNGLAQGKNPVALARMMRDGFGMGFDRALKVNRTEILRVYREASRMQYVESGVVPEYMRMSAKDSRVCMACLMADGTIYATETAFEEHVCGRCTMVPLVNGRQVPGYINGESWFRGLDADQQREMMGAQYFGAWQDGKYDLPGLVKRVENQTWGAALQVTPLGQLVN